MWASVALMAALDLAPMPVNQLKLTNDRVTHGVLGWERKDSLKPKLLPGDIFILLFDIEGLTASDTDGRIKYGVGMELRDPSGKIILSKDPEDLEANAALGGRRLPASAQTGFGTDAKPGTYTMKVTVIDRGAKKNETATLTRTFDVIPTELGLVRLVVTYDTNPPTAAPPLAVPGQVYLVNFAPVFFTLDEKKKQPNIFVEMQVLDETGKPVLKQPYRGGATEASEMYKKIIPMQFILTLNRPGKFKIHLKVTDNLSKKTAEQSLDFVVVEPK